MNTCESLCMVTWLLHHQDCFLMFSKASRDLLEMALKPSYRSLELSVNAGGLDRGEAQYLLRPWLKGQPWPHSPGASQYL